MQIRQLFFSCVTLLLTINVVSVVFNISSSHPNTNLTKKTKKTLLHAQFLKENVITFQKLK